MSNRKWRCRRNLVTYLRNASRAGTLIGERESMNPVKSINRRCLMNHKCIRSAPGPKRWRNSWFSNDNARSMNRRNGARSPMPMADAGAAMAFFPASAAIAARPHRADQLLARFIGDPGICRSRFISLDRKKKNTNVSPVRHCESRRLVAVRRGINLV